MDDTLPLPQDLAACQRLLAKLAAHVRELEAQSAAGAGSAAIISDTASGAPVSHVVTSGSQPAPLSGMQDAPRPLALAQPELPSGTLPLEDLVAQLRDRDARLEELARTVLDLQHSREGLQRDVQTLQLTLDKLLKQIYGRRGERFLEDPTQKKLDFGDDPQAEEAFRDAVAEAQKVVQEIEARRKAKKPPAAKGRSEKFPAHLPRVEKIVDVPPAQKTCATHGARTLIGYDQTETLKIERPKLFVEVTKYPKYACTGKSDCGVTQAPRVTGLVAGNRFDTSIAVEIITQKYAYHLPFYRQQDWFSACGWSPTRSTLLNILSAAEEIFRPLADSYRQIVLGSKVIGCDETPVTLIVPSVIPAIDPMDPRSKRIHEVFTAAQEKDQPSVKARMWAYRGVDIPLNIFDFTVSRHRDGPDEVLAKYNGTLLGDCWSGFQQIHIRSEMRIARAACWAHARRKIFEGRSSHPQQASLLLALIRQLYDIEDRARPLSPADRLALRQRESIPLLNRIRTFLDSVEYKLVLPKSVFAEALGYLRNHWQALLLYTTDGVIPIDNNDVEQLMKQVATGRKNWLFTGSVEAGNRAATLLTLISTAVRHDLDVGAYLKDVLDQLLAGSTDYESLRADLWKQSHPEHVRVYRQEERQEASDRRTHARATRRLPEPKPR
jgi:transposase